jgi:hypothetical protein
MQLYNIQLNLAQSIEISSLLVKEEKIELLRKVKKEIIELPHKGKEETKEL